MGEYSLATEENRQTTCLCGHTGNLHMCIPRFNLFRGETTELWGCQVGLCMCGAFTRPPNRIKEVRK